MTTGNIKQTIQCKGKLISLDEPRIMGILNITPDSFYDGGKYKNINEIVLAAEKMLEDGATWIDIGAVSTRPGSQPADIETEKQRLEPVFDILSRTFPDALLSVDTYRSEIARLCVEKYGVCLINDVSAGNMDSKMIAAAGELEVPYIAMHMRGIPSTMQSAENTKYKDIAGEIINFFISKIKELKNAGVKDIIVDPGFGFSKTKEQNFTLLKELDKLLILDCPVMAGISRKSMIYKTLGTTPDGALNGTLAAHTLALNKGAKILRVHDVKATMDIIKIFKEYSK